MAFCRKSETWTFWWSFCNVCREEYPLGTFWFLRVSEIEDLLYLIPQIVFLTTPILKDPLQFAWESANHVDTFLLSGIWLVASFPSFWWMDCLCLLTAISILVCWSKRFSRSVWQSCQFWIWENPCFGESGIWSKGIWHGSNLLGPYGR